MYREKRLKIKPGSLITAKKLEDLGACDVDDFKKLWPKGVPLRLKNLIKAAKAGLDMYWFASEIMDYRGRWSELYKFEEIYEKLDEEGGENYEAALALWEILKKR